MTFQLHPCGFPNIWGKNVLLFYQCGVANCVLARKLLYRTMLQEFAVIKKGLQDQELIKTLIKEY